MPLLSRPARLSRQPENERADRPAQLVKERITEGGWPGLSVSGKQAGIFAVCANPHCRSGWLHLWRNRETPIFEGGWCCSEACTAVQVDAALAREMDGWKNERQSYRHRIPLGLAMLEQGWITQETLRAALTAQRAAGAGKLGGWLVRQGKVHPQLITRALGLQWGCPVLDLESHNPEGLAALTPRLFVDAFGALPLRVASERILYLGFESCLDATLALAVERITGLRVECGLLEESCFRTAHHRMLEAQYPPSELIEAGTQAALSAALARAVERARPVGARLVRVHECMWLRMWLRPQSGPVPESATIRDVIGWLGAH